MTLLIRIGKIFARTIFFSRLAMSDRVTKLGIVIFPGFAVLDVAGPLQFFNQLSLTHPMQLSIISKTLEPVSTVPPDHLMIDKPLQQIGSTWMPTHTFDHVPDLDILIIPGGFGNRDETIFNEISTFINKVYPKLDYLLSICTGSVMIAATGILDGRRATSNKFAWSFATRYSAVQWVSKARWVVDGNIWSSSGVAAGMDMTYAFIAYKFSPDVAKRIADIIEYEPHTDPDWDPFSDRWNVTSN